MALQTINIADKETLDAIYNKMDGINNKLDNIEFIDDGIVKGDNIGIVGRYIKDSSSSVTSLIINYKNNLYALIDNKMYKFDGERFIFHTLLPMASLKVWTVHNGEIHGLTGDNHIKYDGTKWSIISSSTGLNNAMQYSDRGSTGLLSYNGKLYLIAKNTSTSGTYNGYLWYYTWDGSTWTSVYYGFAADSGGTAYFPNGGDGTYSINSLDGLTVYNGYIYYTTTTGNNTNGYTTKMYRFNGSSSTLVYSPCPESMHSSTVVYNNKLWFTNARHGQIFSFDGNTFTTYGNGLIVDVPYYSVISYYNSKIILLYRSTAYSEFDPSTNKFTNYGLSENLIYNGSITRYGPWPVECDDGIYFVPYSTVETTNFYHVSKDGIMSSAPSLPNAFDFSIAKLVWSGTYLFYIKDKYIYVLNSTSWKLIYTADSPITINTVVYQNKKLYFAANFMLYECSYDGSTATVIEKIHVPYASDISLFSLDNKIYHQKGSCYYDGNDWVECTIPSSFISSTSSELIECNGFLHDIDTVSSSNNGDKTLHYVYDKYFNKYKMDDIAIRGGIQCKLGDKIALLYNNKCYEIDTEIVYAKKAILEAGTIIVFQDDKKHLVKPLLNCEKLPDGNLKVLETGLVRFGSLYISEIGTINIQKS